MVTPSRRGFLIGSTATAVLLSSSQAAGLKTVTAEFSDEIDLSEPLRAGLSVVPSAAELDSTYRTVIVNRVETDDVERLPHEPRRLSRAFGIDPSDMTLTIAITPVDHRSRFAVVVGEFDAPDHGAAVDTVGDWTVRDDGDVALATTADAVVSAAGRSDDRIDTVRTAVETVTGDANGLLSNDDAATAFGLLDASAMTAFVPRTDHLGLYGADAFRGFAAGFEAEPREIEGDTENQYVLFPAAEGPPSDETISEFVAAIDPGIVVDSSVTRGDDAVLVSTVSEAPPEYDPEAAPNARIESSFDAETGAVTVEHVGGEPVPAADAQLWINGELAETQPDDSLDTFEQGDSLSVATGQLATVLLRWFDEAENAHYVYVDTVVDREAFAFAHDIDAGTVTVEHVGNGSPDPGLLEIQHRTETGYAGIEESFDTEDGQLRPGDTVTIADVEIGDSVALELAVPEVPGTHQRSLATFHASPPRIHVTDRLDDGVIARYHDDTERDAEQFRLLVDDEPADDQFADEFETLARGDAVRLGDLPLDSVVTVEWVEPEDPVEIDDHRVVPRAHVSMEYDADDGTVETIFNEGRSLAASDLVLRADGEPTATQPADEHDEFGRGDTVTADIGPFTEVRLVWIGGETEHDIGRTTTGRDAVVGSYDAADETMRVEYVGSEPTDPDPLTVVHRPRNGPGPNGTRYQFADEHDELTTGDAIAVPDVSVGDVVTVTLREETARSTSVRSLAHFRTEPRRAFAFDERNTGLTATYVDELRRDASEFRISVDGTAVDDQPADAHDRLESGDEVSLDALPVGSTLVAEWIAPDEPIEVATHTVAPSASFSGSYDGDAETVTIVHEGGDELAATDIGIALPPALSEPADWSSEGPVTSGDSTSLDVADRPDRAVIVYREREVLHEVVFDREE